MSLRAFIVINPVAGVSRPQDVRATIERVLGKAGWELEYYETTGKEDLPAVVRDAVISKPDLVVAAGGDGTISGVASGLAGSGVPMGIIPAGSWNALARNLEIPGSHEEAARLWLDEHEIQPLDGMRVGQRMYFLNVGVGVSSRLMAQTPRGEKRFLGGLAYIRTLVAELTGLSMRRYRVTVDGKVTKVRAVEVIAVSASLGGVGEMRAHDIFHPGDGRVELCAIRAKTFGQGVMVILRFIAGKRGKNAGILYHRAEHSFTVQTQRRLPVQADGEIVGWTPLVGEVVPHAVKVIVKPGWQARMNERLRAQARQRDIPKWG